MNGFNPFKHRLRSLGCILSTLLSVMLLAAPGYAGDVIYHNVKGQPVGWDPAQPIPVWVYGGDMPKVSQALLQSEVEKAVAMWKATPNARLDLQFSGTLPGPLTADNYESALFLHPENPTDSTPVRSAILIVPDTDGKILEALNRGLSQQVRGITLPIKDPSDPYIKVAIIYLNGIYMDAKEIPLTLRHEMGHALGLTHMESNIDCGQLSYPADESGCEDMPLMRRGFYPNLVMGQTVDDAATLASLYPSDDSKKTTSTVSGRLTLGSTGAPIQGAIIIARNVLNPRHDAISSVTSSDSGSPGTFTLPTLPEGDYRIDVAPILSVAGPGDQIGNVSSPFPALKWPSTFMVSSSGGTKTPLSASQFHVAGGNRYTVNLVQDDQNFASASPPRITDAAAVLRGNVLYAQAEVNNPNGEPLVVWEKRLTADGTDLNPGTWLWDQTDSLGNPFPTLQLTLPDGSAKQLLDTRKVQLYVGGTKWYTNLDDSLPGVPASDMTSVPVDVEPVVGDVNGDGVLTIRDVLLALRNSNGLEPLPLRQRMQADISPLPGTGGRFYGDGQVNIADVIALLRRLLGLETGPLVTASPAEQSFLRHGESADSTDLPFAISAPITPRPYPRGGILIP